MTLQHQVHLNIDCQGQYASPNLGPEAEDKLPSAFVSQLENEVRSQKKQLPDPIDAIKQVMKRRGLTNQDLKPFIGSSGNVCDIMKRRRQLSLAMIRKLHNGLGIPAQVLIQEYQRKRS